jgi:hypothetical protein
MATTYDGSIRINTKIDTSGATTGLSTLTSGLKKFAAVVGISFSVEKIKEFAEASIEAASNLNEVQNVVDTTFGSMSGKINDFASTAAKKFGLSTLAAKQYTGTMGAMLKSSGLTTSAAANMSTSIAGLAGDLASFYNLSTDEAFEKIRSGISGETMPLKQLGINMDTTNLSAYALAQGFKTSYANMSQAQQTIIRYNYLLSVTKNAQGDFARTSNSWANQVRLLQLNFEELEATLGKAFIAVLTPVLSMVNELITDLTYAASVFTDFIYTLTGTKNAASSTAAAVSNLADSTNNSTAATTAGTAATDAASDSLASWDKVNTISSSSTSSGTGTTGVTPTTSTTGKTGTTGATDNDMASKIKTSLSGIYALLITSSALLVIGAILTFSGHPVVGIGLMLAGVVGLAVAAALEWGSIDKTIKEQVSKVQAVVGAALLVLGAIIAFSGANIPLGIALMVAGTANLAIATTVNWGSMSKNIAGVLATIYGMLAGAFLSVGALLAFSGTNMPLGIALMVIGATNLAAAIAIDWNSTGNQISNVISTISGIVGGGMLGVGALLVFSGSPAMGLGIAMMAIGAVTLASAIAVNWNAVNSPLQNTISTITTIVGGALLALGAILAFSNVNIPLGIMLMSVGAASLATTITVNWNSMSSSLRAVITTVTALVGTALLTLGAILTFSNPATMPLGIALMAVGATSLATSVALNWSSIVNSSKEVITEITTLVGTALLALGAILALSNVNVPLGITLMAAGAVSLATAIAINWDSIKAALEPQISGITTLVGTALLTLGAILAFSNVNVPLGIALMAAGAVSLATVIKVNWNAITTALQNPIAAITAEVGAALLVLGAVLCFSGVGIPLGIAMMAAGGVSLASAFAVDWDAIPNKLKGIWTNIKKWWNEEVVSKLTALATWFNKNVINPILSGVENFINFFIKGLNFLIEKVNSISFDLPAVMGGGHVGFALQQLTPVTLPRLAAGAVIPPNRQFMAVLGDQTSGTNIETPLSTMTDAFKSAISEMGISGNSSQPIYITASSNEASIIKYLTFKIDKEKTRVGTVMAAGGVRG